MAKSNVTRSAGGFNSALSSHSIITTLLRARAMIRALVDLTAAERDLGDETGFDPAFSAYRAAVDEARARVLGHCEVLIAQLSATLQAASLQRVAVLVDTVIRSGDPVEVARIRAGLTVARWVWRWRRTSAALMSRCSAAGTGRYLLIRCESRKTAKWSNWFITTLPVRHLMPVFRSRPARSALPRSKNAPNKAKWPWS